MSGKWYEVLKGRQYIRYHKIPLAQILNQITDILLLAIETNEYSINVNPNSVKIPKPPPIFVHGVISYDEMVKQIKNIAEDEQYFTKCLTNKVTRINWKPPETYRKLVRNFKDNNIFHHTYQLKVERAYRVIYQIFHHSTNTEDIKQELHRLGHKVRNIINAQHRGSKEPVNLFFVDLEPADNNKDKICVIWGQPSCQLQRLWILPQLNLK